MVVPRAWEALYHCCNVCGHQRELQSDHLHADESYYEDESYVYFSPFSRWLSAGVAKQRIGVLKRRLNSGHILEIGPGTGEVILAAEQAGYVASAVENSKAFVNHLRSKTKANVYHGLFETADFGDVKFDAVLGFHVLEHIADPISHLKRVFNVTRPGGYLLLATPNARSWDRSVCGSSWTGYSVGHVNIFSPSSIKACLDRSGWSVVELFTVESAWQLLWSIKVRVKPKKNTPQSAGSNVKRIPLRAGAAAVTLWGALTRPLRALQEKLGGGNEIFVVARK